MVQVLLNPFKYSLAASTRSQQSLPNLTRKLQIFRSETTSFGTNHNKGKKFANLPFSSCSGSRSSSSRRRHQDGCQISQIRTTIKTQINFNSTARETLTKIKNSIPSPSAKNMTSSVSDKLPNIVFVLGGPGAGKGTQCTKIVETFGFVHLSAGDLLREERNKPGSEYGEMIEKHIQDGTIVPVEVTCSLIERAMTDSGSSLFLIDGFPRNQNNLDGWESTMANKVNVLFVLFFDAPEEVCVERCLGRGQAGSGRSDDNPESLKKRVKTYVNDTMPIVNYFFEKNLVQKVNAALGPDQVFEEVKAVFNGVLKKPSS